MLSWSCRVSSSLKALSGLEGGLVGSVSNSLQLMLAGMGRKGGKATSLKHHNSASSGRIGAVSRPILGEDYFFFGRFPVNIVQIDSVEATVWIECFMKKLKARAAVKLYPSVRPI